MLTLESEVKLLKPCTLRGGEDVLVAALQGRMAFSNTCVQIIGCQPMNILLTIDNIHMSSIDDLVMTSLIDQKRDDLYPLSGRDKRHKKSSIREPSSYKYYNYLADHLILLGQEKIV